MIFIIDTLHLTKVRTANQGVFFYPSDSNTD